MRQMFDHVHAIALFHLCECEGLYSSLEQKDMKISNDGIRLPYVWITAQSLEMSPESSLTNLMTLRVCSNSEVMIWPLANAKRWFKDDKILEGDFPHFYESTLLLVWMKKLFNHTAGIYALYPQPQLLPKDVATNFLVLVLYTAVLCQDFFPYPGASMMLPSSSVFDDAGIVLIPFSIAWFIASTSKTSSQLWTMVYITILNSREFLKMLTLEPEQYKFRMASCNWAHMYHITVSSIGFEFIHVKLWGTKRKVKIEYSYMHIGHTTFRFRACALESIQEPIVHQCQRRY